MSNIFSCEWVLLLVGVWRYEECLKSWRVVLAVRQACGMSECDQQIVIHQEGKHVSHIQSLYCMLGIANSDTNSTHLAAFRCTASRHILATHGGVGGISHLSATKGR